MNNSSSGCAHGATAEKNTCLNQRLSKEKPPTPNNMFRHHAQGETIRFLSELRNSLSDSQTWQLLALWTSDSSSYTRTPILTSVLVLSQSDSDLHYGLLLLRTWLIIAQGLPGLHDVNGGSWDFLASMIQGFDPSHLLLKYVCTRTDRHTDFISILIPIKTTANLNFFTSVY